MQEGIRGASEVKGDTTIGTYRSKKKRRKFWDQGVTEG